ncbi:unnamed protein product (macronuclear) [Paramecium tetraurelia]|uniref:Tetratricopeptide repeat protein n=1 Tax=Paramecium tetraurelia TaxID=5888 RepID=A0BV75_PARTE|nr:uncharacterized protein GSPATT00005688001 [Paramecium tetraurelia]CAK62442.1 unnamed protein product [Paramecium tetraurelia]|eukprot:XP_001429840.1 hypothetical protein (macronuclear) [Paramecium tetraurelia strain d4-2]
MHYQQLQQNSPNIKCQYAQHEEMPCIYICIDSNCKKKKIACFRCFQEEEYHQNHQGITIEEFNQKVHYRLENINKLLSTLKTFQEKNAEFNKLIAGQVDYAKKLIMEGEKYQQIRELQKEEKIHFYFRLDQDHYAPYLQQQIDKIIQIIQKISKLSKINFQFEYNEEDINKIKNNVINKFREKKEKEYLIEELKKKSIIDYQQMLNVKVSPEAYYYDAIIELNKGLKQCPTNCNLISLKCTCLTNLKQVEKAIQFNEYAFQINQNDETVLLFRAKLKMEAEEYDECIKLYDLATEPNKYLAYYKCISLLFILVDSLKKQQRVVEFEKFQNECLKLFGNEFMKNYKTHEVGSGQIKSQQLPSQLQW